MNRMLRITALSLLVLWPLPATNAASKPLDFNRTGAIPSPLDVHVPNPLPPGYRIIEGDIQVREEDYQAMKGLQKATYETNLWPNGVVPYRFDANMSQADRTAVLNAMQDWADVTAVNFVLRSGENDYVHIRNSDGDTDPACNSAVGIQTGTNQQIINLTSGCLSSFSVHHELAHTLGYRHEHTRPDRDNFVTINWCNIEGSTSCGPNSGGKAGNFQISSSADAYGPYDFDSVMHYSDSGFAVCGTAGSCGDAVTCPSTGPCTTIDALDPTFQNLMGQRTHLSQWDVNVMSYLYPPTSWRFLDNNYNGTNTGTFLLPYQGTLSGALASTPSGGTLVIKSPANYTSTIINQRVTLRAPLGGVVIN